MARKSRPITEVVHSLPAEWRAYLKTSLYKDDNHTSCGEFGGVVSQYESDENAKVSAEDLQYEIQETFKSDTSIGRVQIEFHVQKDGIWKQNTSVNCSRDDYEVQAEKAKHDPADPNTLIFGYMSLCEKCKENGKPPPDFESYVKLHNETIKLTNAGKAEPISTSLVNLSLKREKDALDRIAKREAELDAREKSNYDNAMSALEFAQSQHEKAQRRGDDLAEKLGKNPVAEGIKEAMQGAAAIIEKVASANPGSPVAKIVDAVMISMTEKSPEIISQKVSAIALERVKE